MRSKEVEDGGWNMYKRADGQFVLQYRTSPGAWPEHRIPRKYSNERAAEQYARVFLEEFQSQTKVKDDSPGLPDAAPTIRKLHEKWFELCDENPKLSPATRKQNGRAILIHTLEYAEVADASIADLGPATLRPWLRKLLKQGKVTIRWQRADDGSSTRKLVRGQPMAPYTFRNVVNSLTMFFDDAMAEGWLALMPNPMKHPAVRKEVPEAQTLAGQNVIIHLSRATAERLLKSPSSPGGVGFGTWWR